MKILFLTEGLWSGGRERRLVELLEGLSKYNSIRCELVTMTKEIHYTEIYNLDINIHFIIRRTKIDPCLYFKLFKVCRNFKPNIIHSWGTMWPPYALPIAKLLGIKFINGFISDAPDKIKPFCQSWILSKITFPFSDVILSNSYAGLKIYKAPSKKSLCIYNGFDNDRAKNLEREENTRFKFRIKTEKVVGMVAYFSERKDFSSFILAAQYILNKRDDVTFITVGDGPTFEKIKKMVKSQYHDKIKFLGSKKNIESIINIFNVGVLVSNQDIHGEGISNSILEYMALGKPVIATDGGGTVELVQDKVSGFLIKTKSILEMSSKIEYLLDNEKISKEMGNKGREIVNNKFNLTLMINNYIKLYNRVCKEQN